MDYIFNGLFLRWDEVGDCLVDSSTATSGTAISCRCNERLAPAQIKKSPVPILASTPSLHTAVESRAWRGLWPYVCVRRGPVRRSSPHAGTILVFNPEGYIIGLCHSKQACAEFLVWNYVSIISHVSLPLTLYPGSGAQAGGGRSLTAAQHCLRVCHRMKIILQSERQTVRS